MRKWLVRVGEGRVKTCVAGGPGGDLPRLVLVLPAFADECQARMPRLEPAEGKRSAQLPGLPHGVVARLLAAAGIERAAEAGGGIPLVVGKHQRGGGEMDHAGVQAQRVDIITSMAMQRAGRTGFRKLERGGKRRLALFGPRARQAEDADVMRTGIETGKLLVGGAAYPVVHAAILLAQVGGAAEQHDGPRLPAFHANGVGVGPAALAFEGKSRKGVRNRI
jgi:hypothetical protein